MSVYDSRKKVIYMLIVDTELLMYHVKRVELSECAWEHDTRKWTMEKLNDICSEIY